MTKLQRGQKLCPKCDEINASRQRTCKYCQHEFISKNTPIKNEVRDWKNLEVGTYIKIVQGTGPYFIARRDSEEGVAGERICLGSTGVYSVAGLDSNGIHAYGTTRKNGGFCYLYMGPPHISKATGTHMEANRIKRVKRKGERHGKCNRNRINNK